MNIIIIDMFFAIIHHHVDAERINVRRIRARRQAHGGELPELVGVLMMAVLVVGQRTQIISR